MRFVVGLCLSFVLVLMVLLHIAWTCLLTSLNRNLLTNYLQKHFANQMIST